MSSTEQAPEPTMDEILASIRRIIADDEAQPANRPAAKPTPVRQDAKRTAIADDLAKVLRGSMPNPADDAGAEESAEEDILDLTNEVAEAPPKVQQPAPVRHAAPPQQQPARPPRPEHRVQAAATQPPAQPRPALRMPQATVEARRSQPLPPETRLTQPRLSEPEWDAPPPAAEPDRTAEARNVRAMAMSRIAEVAKDSGARHESAQSYREPETGRELREPPARPADRARAHGGWTDGYEQAEPEEETSAPVSWHEEPEEVPDEVSHEEAAAQPMPAAAAPAPPSATQSLEDCVREMLRPMLRQWLDENLPRILESAVRAEVSAQMQAQRRRH